ncbi:serine/threonine protein kinase [Planctomicrobium piriforme]|uniref:Serine/threonine protein kinase n=1 Tax=Planctomicrobium piriforme TaxID=1576369 RepID=A0A1I3SXE0_9PLAN|nr:serine/threonine-protein kinase [Planctomicrobium piriforme]SFJ62882.1 Serine/threonine protein kinase [Planctomicrobium piriforme]
MKLPIGGSRIPVTPIAIETERWPNGSSRRSDENNPQRDYHWPQIGRYDVIEEISRGGQGIVYRCRDPQLQRHVAIKVACSLPSDLPLSRLAQEGALLAQIDHPGLACVYDAGVHERLPYLVMEFVPGVTLRKHVEQQGVTLQEIRRIIRELSSALWAAHQQGILHLDLKPENVLVQPDGRCKLIDFGLGWLLKEAGLPELPLVMGTVGYLSPEQASGQTASWSVATDVYGLGKVLQFLLNSIRKPNRSWLEQREVCRLQRICDKAIAVEPQKRFASVTEFAAEVSYPVRLRQRCLGAASIVLGILLFGVGISLGRAVTLPVAVPHASAAAAQEPRYVRRLKLDLSIITQDGNCPHVEIWTPSLGMIPLTGLSGIPLDKQGRMEWSPGTSLGAIGGDLRDQVLVVMAFARPPEFDRRAISKGLSVCLSKTDLAKITSQQSWTFSQNVSPAGSETPLLTGVMARLREECDRCGIEYQGIAAAFPEWANERSLEIRFDLCAGQSATPASAEVRTIDATCLQKGSCNSLSERPASVLDR